MINIEHKSYGLDITKKRIEIYNQKYGSEKSFKIEDILDCQMSAVAPRSQFSYL